MQNIEATKILEIMQMDFLVVLNAKYCNKTFKSVQKIMFKVEGGGNLVEEYLVKKRK